MSYERVFHISLTGWVDEHGRLTTRCYQQRPERYVFDEPVDGQPMCEKCMDKWRELSRA